MIGENEVLTKVVAASSVTAMSLDQRISKLTGSIVFCTANLDEGRKINNASTAGVGTYDHASTNPLANSCAFASVSLLKVTAR